MKSKNKIVYIMLVVIISLSVGCKIQSPIEEGQIPIVDDGIMEELEAVEGGMVSIPLTNFSTLNPLITDNSSYYHFSKLIFQGIFEFDDNLKPTLSLGESYKLSEDGKTISIKLRDDVKWHDGNPLTSLDVEFTIDAIKKANMDSTYGKLFGDSVSIDGNLNLRRFINTKIIDEKNIDIIFDREFSNVLDILTFPIIPKHRFPSLQAALATEDYLPMGTGPFRFVGYEKFKSVNLKKNLDYWDGPVYIEEIMGRVLDDNELILTSFETGQIDLAFSMDVDWDKYRQNNRIKSFEYISAGYEFLGFNFKDENISKEEAIALRKAINYGIDRQNIIENVYLGHGSQVDLPLHPRSYLMDDISDKYGYNLNIAKEELRKGGYIDRDGDGIVEDQEGNPLDLILLTNTYNSSRFRTGEIIIEDLRKLGINVTLFQEDTRSGFASQEEKDTQWNIMEDNLQKGNYHLVLLGWKTSVIPNISHMFHSSKLKTSNFINYQDEIMDKLLENSLESSLASKKINYKDLQKHILEDLPYVSLFYKNEALLVDSRIKGEINPSFFNLYRGLEKCFILKE